MKEKYITYYFDSNTYNKIQIIENLRKECETQYFGKEAQIDIQLNEFGTYIATLVFEPKENKITQLIKANDSKIKEKVHRITMIKKKRKSGKKYLSQPERKYGAYKQTGTFRPI